MTDVVDAATRSRMMAGIQGKNTTPELMVRSGLHRLGLRFGLRTKSLPGKPDLILSRHKTAVFVHGCFWHAHQCPYFRLPSSNPVFWKEKLSANVQRDKKQVVELKALGWRVLVIWECAVKGASETRNTQTYEVARDWVLNYDARYIEISKGRGNGISKRQSTSRAL